MSISTPQGGGDESRQSGPVRVAGKSAASHTEKSPSARPGTAGGRGPKKPITPVKVAKQRDWTWIGIAGVAVVLAIAIVGFAVWQNWSSNRSWQSKADGISGIVDYRKTDPDMLTRNHKWGPLTYKVSPPVGGDHNYNWQRCAGDVYPAQIANEHAVHSLEHGAVWITYNPSLPQDQVNALAEKVRGVGDYILMSPYPGLKSPISLQAWGFSLAVDKASDPRIDAFIKDLRINATEEPGVDCASGTYITATGTTPHDIGQNDPNSGLMPGASGSPSATEPSAPASGSPSSAPSSGTN